MTTNPKIYNIPSEEEELRKMISEPLLVDAGTDTDADGPVKPQPSSSSCSHSKFVVLGSVTGFFIQVVSLGAYALLLLHYNKYLQQSSNGDNNENMDLMTFWSSTDSSMDSENWKNMVNVDWFIYGILSVLTQIDLVIYVLIWIAFTCTMTKNGMTFLRMQYQNPALKRRAIFVLGVYFLVGIVLGAFAAWSMIDVYLGFPIPFLPIVATVLIDLVLCYMMVWCYDLGRSNSSSVVEEYEACDGDDDDEEECICC